jgi:hypothetical protein
MKLKVYDSEYDRRSDRIIGIIAFPIVNGALWLLQSWLLGPGVSGRYLSVPASLALVTAIEAFPWVVNGVLLLLALIYRPEIAIGYLGFLGGILLLGGALAAIVVVSCVVSIPVILISPQLGTVVWVSLMVVGALFFGIKLVSRLLSNL